MDSRNSLVQAVLIAGGRIECTGPTRDILAAAGEDALITDLEMQALFPGFIDTHSHLSMYSAWSEHVYCGAEAGTLEGALDRLRARAEETPPGELILGWGFDDSILPENRGPTRKELDAVSAGHPILLVHISAHAGYVNSAALKAAGLSAASRVEGGEIVPTADGEALGTLLENAFFIAMAALCPSPTPEALRRTLTRGVADYNAYGFTATHEAGVGLGGINPAMYLRVLQQMEKEDALNMRVRLSFLPEEFERYADMGIQTGFGSRMVSICGPKIFNDGSIQAYTAALSRPYHDRPDHCPGLLIPEEKLTKALVRYHSDGYQITYHGNGDLGIEAMITAIEKAQRVCPRPDPRHVLIHCQTASDSQLARMKAVGITPSFFGLHVWYYGDRHYERFLGPERASRIDPSGSAVRLGMRHSLHADSPVMPPWTLRSIHTAVNRKTRNGRILGEDQRITAEEAVRAYTSHAAWLHFAEHERGSIEPGKLADFVLLSEDLLSMDPEGIADASVRMTMVEGRIVYRA